MFRINSKARAARTLAFLLFGSLFIQYAVAQVGASKDIPLPQQAREVSSRAPASVTESVKPLKVDDLLSMRGFGNVIVTPDGKKMFFDLFRSYKGTVNSGALSFYDRRPDGNVLSVLATKSSAAVPLFAQQSKYGYWLGSLAPDARHLSVFSLEEGRLRVSIVNLETGRLVKLSAIPRCCQQNWTPLWIDSAHMLLSIEEDGSAEGASLDREHVAAEVSARWRRAFGGSVPSVTVRRSATIGQPEWRSFASGRLVIVSMRGAVQELGQGEFVRLTLSPNGKYLAGLRTAGRLQPGSTDYPGDTQVDREQLVIFDLDTRKPAAMPCDECDVVSNTVAWSANSAALSFVAHHIDQAVQDSQVFQYSMDSGELQTLNTNGFTFSCATGIGSDSPLSIPVPVFDGQAMAFGNQATEKESEGLLSLVSTCLNGSPSKNGGRWYLLSKAAPPRLLVNHPKQAESGVLATTPTEVYLFGDQALWRTFASGQVEKVPLRVRGELESIQLRKYANEDGATPGWQEHSRILLQDTNDVLQYHISSGAVDYIPKPATDARVLGVSEGSKTAVFQQDARGVSQLLVSEEGSGRVVSKINTHLDHIVLGRETQVLYSAPDGETLHSCMLLPPNYVAGKRYPLVAVVYPYIETGDCWGANPDRLFPLSDQVMASQEYIVLYPAVPKRLTKMPDSAPDAFTQLVMLGVQAAIDRGFADSDRIAVMGLSQGMRECLQVLTQTHRFKAAIAAIGLSDFVSAYGTVALREFVDDHAHMVPESLRFEGSNTSANALNARPWEDPTRYIDHSPLFSANSITTPVMIINSDLDGFDIGQGQEMFSALYRLRRNAELVTYWGEAHGPISPANVRDYWKRVEEWFDLNLDIKRDGTGHIQWNGASVQSNNSPNIGLNDVPSLPH